MLSNPFTLSRITLLPYLFNWRFTQTCSYHVWHTELFFVLQSVLQTSFYFVLQSVFQLGFHFVLQSMLQLDWTFEIDSSAETIQEFISQMKESLKAENLKINNLLSSKFQKCRIFFFFWKCCYYAEGFTIHFWAFHIWDSKFMGRGSVLNMQVFW